MKFISTCIWYTILALFWTFVVWTKTVNQNVFLDVSLTKRGNISLGSNSHY